MKIEIKKFIRNSDTFFAAYHEGSTTFISRTCVLLSDKTEEEAIARCGELARLSLINQEPKTIKTIEV